MAIEFVPAYDRLDDIRVLFQEYTGSLKIDLSYQNYQQELSGLPGKYAPPGGRLYLALVDGQAAGCIALRPLEGGSCEIKRLYVRPGFRGHRLGRLLAEQILKDAAACGYQCILLDTLLFFAKRHCPVPQHGLS